jgi:hypothetical protein
MYTSLDMLQHSFNVLLVYHADLDLLERVKTNQKLEYLASCPITRKVGRESMFLFHL